MIEILPYKKIDGIPSFTDSFIRHLYQKMVFDNTANTVFYDGEIQNEDQFLNAMQYGENHLITIVNDKDLKGIAWINGFEMRWAWFHFCFFSNAWKEDTIAMGKKAVMYFLELKNHKKKFLFDILVGMVPTRNLAACGWCAEMGFEVLGRLPKSAYIASEDISEDGMIYYVERGEYHG